MSATGEWQASLQWQNAHPLKAQLYDSMSQTLSTLLLYTQKCVLLLHKKSTYFKSVVQAGKLGCNK